MLGPDWKNCDDVDECATGDCHHPYHNYNDNDDDDYIDECATGDCHRYL